MASKPPMKVTVLPAGHGDCVLVQCGDFIILVDSGPISADIHAYMCAALSRALDGREIDLAIITHHDEDHIGGLHRILQNGQEQPIRVKQLLFNSPSLITRFINRDKEQAASFRHADTVARLLQPCNHEVVYAGHPPLKFDEDRVVLTMLSPAPEHIDEFGSKIAGKADQKKDSDDAADKEEPAGLRGKAVRVVGSLDSLKIMVDKDDDHDRSKSNALSLAFALTFGDRALLFLGDSWASTVEASFDAQWPEDTRKKFDVVFVSHHGSKNNTTENLYKRIDCQHYVICADGKSHPDAQTLRRIQRGSGWNGLTFYISENTPELRTMFADSPFVRLPQTTPITFNL